MSSSTNTSKARRRSAILVAALLLLGTGLAAWKFAMAQDADARAANQPETSEVVVAAAAQERPYRDATTAIGTIVATRSVSLRNEVPGTVATVRLEPGRVVDPGALLVALDVGVERAELRAAEARAELAESTLTRYERMAERQAASAIELDNVRAERDIAQAEIERLRAVIERKTIRAPFQARVGIADVHPGQFLEIGTLLTTLQGVDDGAYVDFTVAQLVAAGLAQGDDIEIVSSEGDSVPAIATVTAVDARVDPATRNAVVRARLEGVGASLTPGASVRVRVPVGVERPAVFVPVSALRRGPAGDHVFVLEGAEDGHVRARMRHVTTGPVVGREVVVLEGVQPGERLAASGSFKLRDGVLVRVTAPGAEG